MKNFTYTLFFFFGAIQSSFSQYVVSPSNWAQAGLAGDTVNAIAATDNYVVAGTRRGVFLSFDLGQNWLSFNKGLSDTDKVITAVLIDTSGIYIGNDQGEVFKTLTADTAANWLFLVDDFLALNGRVDAVSEIKRSGTNLFFNVCCGGCGSYISQDNGNNWVANIIGDACHTQKASYKNYAVAGGFFGPFLSYDNGLSWKKFQRGIMGTGDFSPTGVVFNDFSAGFYYSDAVNLYYNSKWSGTNMLKPYMGDFDTTYFWEKRDISLASRFAEDVDPSKLWAIGSNTLYLLNLGGYVWPQYTSPNQNSFLSLALNSNYVFIGQDGGGVIRGLKDCKLTSFFEIRPANPNDTSGIYNAYNMSTSSAGTSYLWDFGDGTTSTQQYPSHTYTNAGNYIVCLTVSFGINCSFSYCDSTLYKAFKTDGFGALKQLNVLSPALTSVKDMIDETPVLVYPNPTNGTVNISYPAGKFNTMKIYNITGELVLETLPKESIDVAQLPKGVYILRLEGTEKSSLQKFTIN